MTILRRFAHLLARVLLLDPPEPHHVECPHCNNRFYVDCE